MRNFDVNAPVFNQYLPRQAEPYDVTVVRFIGRGQEAFSDEIINVFEWMYNLSSRVRIEFWEVVA